MDGEGKGESKRYDLEEETDIEKTVENFCANESEKKKNYIYANEKALFSAPFRFSRSIIYGLSSRKIPTAICYCHTELQLELRRSNKISLFR